MADKLIKIQQLKQLILQMQTEIQQLSRPPRSSPSKPRYKSPTFWGTNPIVHPPLSPRQSRSNSKSRDEIKRSISPKFRNISNKVNEQFYASVPSVRTDETPLGEKDVNRPERKQENNCNLTFNRRFENSEFGLRRETPRFEKKRTYDHKKTEPILNPEPEKETRKKIVKRIEPSPNQMLTENPKSNVNLYVFANNPICLERKGGGKVDKNRSSDIRLILSSSLDRLSDSVSRPSNKSHKKHFHRYFQENINSRWE